MRRGYDFSLPLVMFITPLAEALFTMVTVLHPGSFATLQTTAVPLTIVWT